MYGGQPGPGALRAPLKTLEIFITGSRRHKTGKTGKTGSCEQSSR
jgi:hypothetical protein